MNTSPEINELAKALSSFQGTVQTVKRDSANPHFRSRFASLESAITTAAPHLAAHGLAVAQTLSWDGSNDLLTTTLMHTSGQWIVDGQRLFLNKEDAQSHGSAITYARRYALQSILNLAAADDDGNSLAMEHERRPRPVQPAPQSAPQPAQEVRRADPAKPISQPQQARLFAIAKTANADNPSIKNVIKHFGYQHSKDIKNGDYDRICECFKSGQWEQYASGLGGVAETEPNPDADIPATKSLEITDDDLPF